MVLQLELWSAGAICICTTGILLDPDPIETRADSGFSYLLYIL